MVNYKNIAVAVDFSEQSVKAVNHAKSLALDYGAKLTLIAVCDTNTFGTVEAYDTKYAEQLQRELQVKLEEMKQKAIEAGVEQVVAKVEVGKSKVILTELPNINLMVIGATGLNKAEKFVLGSVSERVVRHSKYDVLVVRN